MKISGMNKKTLFKKFKIKELRVKLDCLSSAGEYESVENYNDIHWFLYRNCSVFKPKEKIIINNSQFLFIEDVKCKRCSQKRAHITLPWVPRSPIFTRNTFARKCTADGSLSSSGGKMQTSTLRKELRVRVHNLTKKEIENIRTGLSQGKKENMQFWSCLNCDEYQIAKWGDIASNSSEHMCDLSNKIDLNEGLEEYQKRIIRKPRSTLKSKSTGMIPIPPPMPNSRISIQATPMMDNSVQPKSHMSNSAIPIPPPMPNFLLASRSTIGRLSVKNTMPNNVVPLKSRMRNVQASSGINLMDELKKTLELRKFQGK